MDSSRVPIGSGQLTADPRRIHCRETDIVRYIDFFSTLLELFRSPGLAPHEPRFVDLGQRVCRRFKGIQSLRQSRQSVQRSYLLGTALNHGINDLACILKRHLKELSVLPQPILPQGVVN